MGMADTERQTSCQNHYRQLWGSYCMKKRFAMVFHHGMSATRTEQLQKNSPFRTLLQSLVPVVHAEDCNSDQKEQSDGLTLSDRVAQHRPQVVVTDEDIEGYIAKESGWDRLSELFPKGKQHSPEVELVINVSRNCAVISFMVMCVAGGRMAREEFIESNKHTKFNSRFRAVRSCNDAVLVGGIKLGGKWALKTGLFTASFIAISQGIAVYRNKSSVLEYTAAGAVTGALTRLNLGLRGFVAGSIIGAVVGTVGGVVMFGCMKMGNETQEQRHYQMVHNKIRHNREMELFAQSGADTSDVTPATI